MSASVNVETETADDQTLTLDRRKSDRRSAENQQPAKPKKVRRRHIDPTTCERDYSQPEVEFMRAMDEYKQESGRMFPTCSEVLEVLRSLGYVQLTPEQLEQLGIEDNEEEELVAAEESL